MFFVCYVGLLLSFLAFAQSQRITSTAWLSLRPKGLGHNFLRDTTFAVSLTLSRHTLTSLTHSLSTHLLTLVYLLTPSLSHWGIYIYICICISLPDGRVVEPPDTNWSSSRLGAPRPRPRPGRGRAKDGVHQSANDTTHAQIKPENTTAMVSCNLDPDGRLRVR